MTTICKLQCVKSQHTLMWRLRQQELCQITFQLLHGLGYKVVIEIDDYNLMFILTIHFRGSETSKFLASIGLKCSPLYSTVPDSSVKTIRSSENSARDMYSARVFWAYSSSALMGAAQQTLKNCSIDNQLEIRGLPLDLKYGDEVILYWLRNKPTE